MPSAVAVQLLAVQCSATKYAGEKVRVGCSWSSTTTAKSTTAAPATSWTNLCILQKPFSTQAIAGWTPGAESPLSRGNMSFPNVELSNQSQMTLTIEMRGMFSSTVVCTMVVDVHELAYSGTLSGPFFGTSNGGKVKWMVTGSIQLSDETPHIPQPAAQAPPPAAFTNTRTPPLAPEHQQTLPRSILLSPSLLPSSSALAPVAPTPLTPTTTTTAATAAPIPLTSPANGLDASPEVPPSISIAPSAALLPITRAALSKAVEDSIMALEYPPYIAAKIYARGSDRSGVMRSGVRPQLSRLAALILAPCRDGTLTASDLEFLSDSFSVDLGHSVVTTVGENASISSALWRPELASTLNTAGKAFGTNSRSDVGTQTGDVAQLLSKDYVAHYDSAAAAALRSDAKDRLENSKAFHILKHDILEANRREMQAVAEAQELRVALAKAMHQLRELRNDSTGDDDDDEDDLFGVPIAYRSSRSSTSQRSRHRANRTSSSTSVRSRGGGGASSIWHEVLSSSQSAVSTPSSRKQRPNSISPPSIRPSNKSNPISGIFSTGPTSSLKRPLSQDVFQTGSQVGVRGRSRSIGFSDDDIL